jgi:hypothetical protein
MKATAKTLLVVALIAGSTTTTFAQYYRQVPAEQQHWYDRNAVGQNVRFEQPAGTQDPDLR